MLRFLGRNEIDALAWDACVAASAQRIVYGYSWYLDAVAGGSGWQWLGLVLIGENDGYQAVMPVPLRRRFGVWVVHQPLFCQFLAIFSPDETLDATPFLRAVQQRYRHGSVLCIRPGLPLSADFSTVFQRTTLILDLRSPYETIARHYSRDRLRNLRRANEWGWHVTNSTDPEPLLTLFAKNHANKIDGGVGAWAYDRLRRLIAVLQARGLATIQYARQEGEDRIEAGALFVQEGNRIIYLFNAASEAGRRGNARTLLIDQVIRENAGQPWLFDFESPEKPSIRGFYQSFGTTEVVFQAVGWSRVTGLERVGAGLLRWLNG